MTLNSIKQTLLASLCVPVHLSVCQSVWLWCFNFWKPRRSFWYAAIHLHNIFRSSLIKVIGSRLRSQKQSRVKSVTHMAEFRWKCSDFKSTLIIQCMTLAACSHV